MNRYTETFAELKKKGEGAFIPFVVLGDPDFETSKKILEKLVHSADCLELGFPFSDPIADGKRIQAADERALRSGMSVEKCFELVSHVRKMYNGIPIGLLVYYNLAYSNGVEKFLAKAKAAGVDGILVADMPIEESTGFCTACRKERIEQIFIVAPTTGKKRMREILRKAGGFIYLVSVLGVTGERKEVESSTIELIGMVKKQSKLPVCVGFGISQPEQVKKIISAGADGAIVGSAVEAVIELNLADKNALVSAVDSFARELKGATKI